MPSAPDLWASGRYWRHVPQAHYYFTKQDRPDQRVSGLLKSNYITYAQIWLYCMRPNVGLPSNVMMLVRVIIGRSWESALPNFNSRRSSSTRKYWILLKELSQRMLLLFLFLVSFFSLRQLCGKPCSLQFSHCFIGTGYKISEIIFLKTSRSSKSDPFPPYNPLPIPFPYSSVKIQ